MAKTGLPSNLEDHIISFIEIQLKEHYLKRIITLQQIIANLNQELKELEDSKWNTSREKYIAILSSMIPLL